MASNLEVSGCEISFVVLRSMDSTPRSITIISAEEDHNAFEIKVVLQGEPIAGSIVSELSVST
jgi:uncharacterized protein YgbK (DUF1537 family)